MFKAGDNWLSKAIAWITDSDVSHAAMMLDDGRMVEMWMDGIYVSHVEALEGDDAILLRLRPERDPLPLADAAQKYLDCETRYDLPALAFLAGAYHLSQNTSYREICGHHGFDFAGGLCGSGSADSVRGSQKTGQSHGLLAAGISDL